MPIYVYYCSQCGHTFEELVRSMDSNATITCPQCQNTQTQRRQAPFATSSSGSADTAPCGAPAPM